MVNLIDYRRKKTPRSRFSCCSKSTLLLLCAISFLAYTFYTRSSNKNTSSLFSQFSLSRRDLKEKYQYVQALLHAQNSSLHGKKATIFPTTSSARRVLLATHNRLMWYYYDTQELTVIHENQGIYYGGLSGEKLDENGTPATLWVVSRPHNWRPKTAQEWMLHLDAKTGKELERVPLDSRFTHDVVRHGNTVYVANTGEGHIIELQFPTMKEVNRYRLFTEREHVNTLSPTVDGRMWAMLHNLGPSILAEIDLATGTIVRRIHNVGVKSHGAVQWRNFIIALNSDEASLIKIDARISETTTLWTSEQPNRYLKALAIVDDIAFFGIAEAKPRQSRDSQDLNCELAAFDLLEGVLLWRRQLATRGLLNVVAAPHLQVESTAIAVYTATDPNQSYRHTESYKEVLKVAKAGAGSMHKSVGTVVRNTMELEGVKLQKESIDGKKTSIDTSNDTSSRGNNVIPVNNINHAPILSVPTDHPLSKYPPIIGGKWASGMPMMELSSKDRTFGLSGGAQMLLFKANVAALKEYVLKMPMEDWGEESQTRSNAWLSGRAKNLNQFKPGVLSIHLIFSDQDGKTVFEFPWYNSRFAKLLNPILTRLLGADMQKIIRLQFALMPAGTHIKRHVDKGGYSADGHRIHLVVATNDGVMFKVCDNTVCIPLILEEGLVFELNNRLDHFVNNNGTSPRVHLVIDVAELPRERIKLKPGQVCWYNGGSISC